MKKLLLLDFDETVSPIHPSDSNDFESFHFGFECLIHNDVLDFLQEISKNENVDVFWLTSWGLVGEYFNEKSQGKVPLFKDIPCLNGQTVKEKRLETFLEENKYCEIMACDDSLKTLNQFKKLLNASKGYSFSYVKPKKAIGITRNDIIKILEWANNS